MTAWGLGVTHGADDGEAVADGGHMQIGKEDVEPIVADVAEGFRDGGGCRDVEVMNVQDGGEG